MPVPRSTSLWRLLSLRSDQASPDLIDAAMRDNSRFAGTYLWVLMFAIVIASLGKDSHSNRPTPGIPNGAAPVDAGLRLPVQKQLRHLPLAGAQLPNLVAAGPGTPRSLQRARKRTQREAGVVPHQVMR